MDLFAPLTSIAFAVIAYIIGSVKVVNEGEAALVERLGRYRRTLSPGLNFTLPLLDTLIIDTTREQVFDVPPQEAVTADGATVSADAVVMWQISELYKVHYEVDDVKEAIESLVLTTLRTRISRLTVKETFTAREELRSSLIAELNTSAREWGVMIRNVNINDIKLSAEMRKEMENARIAEDRKRTSILEAEAKSEAAKREADSRRQAAISEAEGIVAAVAMISEMLEKHPNNKSALQDVLKYLVAQRYVAASQSISESNNSKVIFMDPHSLTEAVNELIAHAPEPHHLPGPGGNGHSHHENN
jgi:regulator of protease activity HflC (stomatin/prohibitin superfamily)